MGTILGTIFFTIVVVLATLYVGKLLLFPFTLDEIRDNLRDLKDLIKEQNRTLEKILETIKNLENKDL